MKNILHSFFLLLICTSVSPLLWSQSLKNLEDNNGFKVYKMGSKYNKTYGIKNKAEDGTDKVVIDYTEEKIGDIPVKLIELIYMKDTLCKIIVRVSPESYNKLIEACRNAFGPPARDLSDNKETRKKNNQAPASGNNYTDKYLWQAKRFSMEYFYSYPVYSGGGAVRDLYLAYTLNDYAARLLRIKKGNYTPKDF